MGGRREGERGIPGRGGGGLSDGSWECAGDDGKRNGTGGALVLGTRAGRSAEPDFARPGRCAQGRRRDGRGERRVGERSLVGGAEWSGFRGGWWEAGGGGVERDERGAGGAGRGEPGLARARAGVRGGM